MSVHVAAGVTPPDLKTDSLLNARSQRRGKCQLDNLHRLFSPVMQGKRRLGVQHPGGGIQPHIQIHLLHRQLRRKQGRLCQENRYGTRKLKSNPMTH